MTITNLLLVFLFLVAPAYAYGTNGCDSSTTTLIHFDGADAATNPGEEDCDGNGKPTISVNGDAQLDTAQTKMGPSSALYDGTGDGFYIPDNAGQDFGTGDFTIDMWVRFAVDSTTADLATKYSSGTNRGWIFAAADAGTTLKLYDDNNGTTNVNVTWDYSINIWYHIAVVRSGNNIYFFVDGVQQGATQTASANGYNGAASTETDFGFGNVAVGAMNGWQDEVRITKGIARWTTAFTPPGTPYCSGCEMKEVLN